MTTRMDPPPQRWAVVAAWGALLSAVPSALWRLLMIAGLMPGTADLRALHADEVGYVVGLSVAQLVAGVLVVGLVRPWGERLLGVPVPRWFPVVMGALGALAMTWLFTIDLPSKLLSGVRPDQDTVHGVHLAVMIAAYVPIFAFGPLALVAVVGYALRRYRSATIEP